MTALIVIGVIALLLLAVNLTRVGIVVGNRDSNKVYLKIRFGFFRIKLLPLKDKKPEKEKKPKKEKPKKDKPKADEQKKKAGFDLSLITELIPVGLDAGKRFMRGLRVGELYVNVILGGEDPAKLAINYGNLYMLSGIIVPYLEDSKNVSDYRIGIYMDYGRSGTEAKFHLDITTRIWRLVAIGISSGIKLLQIIRRNRKKGAEPEETRQTA